MAEEIIPKYDFDLEPPIGSGYYSGADRISWEQLAGILADGARFAMFNPRLLPDQKFMATKDLEQPTDNLIQ